MPGERSIPDVLNDLLVLERSSLVGRLDEIKPYIGPGHLHLAGFPQRAATESRHRAARLMELIISHGGLPAGAARPTLDAGAHYLTLAHLAPRVVNELERGRQAYESAARQLPKGPLRNALTEMATQQAQLLEQLRPVLRQGETNTAAAGGS